MRAGWSRAVRRTVFFFETTWIVKRCSDSLPPDATDASDSESRWPSGEPSASLDTRKKSPHAEVPTFATGLNSASAYALAAQADVDKKEKELPLLRPASSSLYQCRGASRRPWTLPP